MATIQSSLWPLVYSSIVGKSVFPQSTYYWSLTSSLPSNC